MVSLRLFALLSAISAVIAAPIIESEAAVNVTEIDRTLRNGEVLVVGDNRAQIVTEEAWKLFVESSGASFGAPEVDYDFLKSGDAFAENIVNDTSLDKRDCNSNFQFVVDRTQRFVDWDVQMSPVIIGAGRNGIDIRISKSFSIENKVQVSAGIDLGLIKKVLGLKLGINYSRSWKTEVGTLIRGTIDDGYTGTVITMPWTNRRYGRTFQGCVGSLKQTGTFMADSREEGSYEGVSWVGGAITACIKKQRGIPLSRCHGSGNFR
ncbi:uncharacterized protein CTRU02_212409 [Colletotrichum truncatum]|uniref:Uncharacterized protein n=1 Tax=Colletotrichum truncatum TaxID=5467 RepID=A0ACC3YNJ1_COLTU|nr:uncharacterized protein CTRU02_08720 [Colletotrichum truncatum]KAF6789473.1 hypothetical protein CTRU02_08720 [Colletotrichum truncatum]